MSYITIPVGASVPSVINDGHTKAWYDYNVGVTKIDASVSIWADRLGSGRDLLQATGASQPSWSSDGILFDGVDDFMKTSAFIYNQPEQIYLVMKQVTWTLNDRFFDGNTTNDGTIQQYSTTPQIFPYAGTGYLTDNNLPIDTFAIIKLLFNGTNSKLQVNTNTILATNFGTNNMGGFTLGCIGSIDSQWSNIQVKEIILRDIADTPETETAIYNYLSNKYFGTNLGRKMLTLPNILGPELVDQNAWFTSGYWNVFGTYWSQVGSTLVCSGTNSDNLKTNYFTLGKTYRVTVSAIRNSGQCTICDFVNWGIPVINATGTYVYDFVAEGTGLWFYGQAFDGTITLLSIKEVYKPKYATLPYCREALAYFDRMEVQPPAELKQLLNTTIQSMKDNGIWGELDEFWFMNLHTSQASSLGVKGYKDASLINDPTFTAKIGIYSSVSGSKYINTNYNPSSDNINLSLNNAGVYMTRINYGTDIDIGFSGSGTSDGGHGFLWCESKIELYLTLSRVNETGGTNYGALNDGYNSRVRDSSTTVKVIAGGSETNYNRSSTGITDHPFLLGNLEWQSDLTSYRNNTLYKQFGVGSSMNATKRAAFQTILNDFNDRIQLYNYGQDFCQEAVDYFNRMDELPPAGLQISLNDAIVAMKTAGIWNELDQFVFMNLHTAQASKLDIKGNINHVWVNDPSWYANEGVTTDGSTNYVNTKFNAATGVKFTLNDCGIYFWRSYISGDGGDGAEVNPGGCQITNGVYYLYNCINSWSSVFEKIWTNGVSFAVKYDNTHTIARTNGIESNYDQTAVQKTNAEYYLGSINYNAALYFSSNLYKQYGFGSSMDLTKRNAFETILNNFNKRVQLYNYGLDFCQEAIDYFLRMDEIPATGLQILLNQTIQDMINAGIWNELDQFVFMNLHTAQASKLDIKNNINHIWVNDPSWNEKVGVFTDGATTYVNTKFVPINSTKYLTINGGVYSYVDSSIADNGFDGAALTVGNLSQIGFYYNIWDYVNGVYIGPKGFIYDAKIQFYCLLPNQTVLHRFDGTETIIAGTGVGRDTGEWYIGRINYTDSYIHSVLYKQYGFGSAMDLTKRAALETILNNFNTQITTAY